MVISRSANKTHIIFEISAKTTLKQTSFRTKCVHEKYTRTIFRDAANLWDLDLNLYSIFGFGFGFAVQVLA
jgi:hypothetical protein